MKKVLVAGATGLVGKHLVNKLLEQGLSVNILSTRKEASIKGTQTFTWNPQKYKMESEALNGVDAIVNLAGATIDKRWTPAYKQIIYDSRTQTGDTLFKTLQKQKENLPEVYISASGINFYPSNKERVFTEVDEPATDFFGQVCSAWERSADKMQSLNMRVIKLRIGVVLSNKGGMLKKIEPLAKTGLLSPLGNGAQNMSWIHIDDLCEIILFGLNHTNVSGAYNAIGPEHITNRAFTTAFAQQLNRPSFLPAVPKAVLKIALGEMAEVATSGVKASPQKIISAGYTFQYPNINSALANLYA